MKKNNLIISSILAATMLTIGSAGVVHAYGGPNAGPNAGPNSGPMNGPCGHQRESQSDRMAYMMNRLELDRKQRDAIKKIRDEQDKQMQAKMDEMKKIRKEMREQAMAEKYDAAKVRELADTQAKLMSDMMVERMATMDRIRKLLTEQQAARMEQMKAQMMQNRPDNGGM
jgi:Spy/CpxP family protein refolding chaperone